MASRGCAGWTTPATKFPAAACDNIAWKSARRDRRRASRTATRNAQCRAAEPPFGLERKGPCQALARHAHRRQSGARPSSPQVLNESKACPLAGTSARERLREMPSLSSEVAQAWRRDRDVYASGSSRFASVPSPPWWSQCEKLGDQDSVNFAVSPCLCEGPTVRWSLCDPPPRASAGTTARLEIPERAAGSARRTLMALR
jgi:hypothetical protein